VHLRPWNDNFTAILLLNTFDGPDLGTEIRKRIHALYERNAANDPAWRRALRALLFYEGSFENAQKLAHELAAEKDPRWAYRDMTMAALIDRVLGDRKAFDVVVDQCPPPPDSVLKTTRTKPGDLCWSVAVNAAFRYSKLQMHFEQPQKVPAALRDIFVEAIRSPRVGAGERYQSVLNLVVTDPAAAERELLAIIESRPLPEWLGFTAYTELAHAQLAQRKAREANETMDRYLAETFDDPGFDPAQFATVEFDPALRIGADDFGLALKVRVAIAATDFAGAQRALEQQITLGYPHTSPLMFWNSVLDLANAEISALRRDDAMRIAGWLATKKLDESRRLNLLSLRRLLGTPDKPAEPPPQKTPWDSSVRDRGHRREPQTPHVKT